MNGTFRPLAVLAVVAFVAAVLPAPAVAGGPPNDFFVNATHVTIGYHDSLSTSQATTEVGEPTTPLCGGTIGATVWYRFRSHSTGYYHADTIGSNYDTWLVVYKGASLGSLSETTCDNDSGSGLTSSLNWQGHSGETFYIQAGGNGAASGMLHFAFHHGVDTVVPTVSQPFATLQLHSKLGSGSTRVLWDGFDYESGMASFELQKSTNGGAWQPVALPTPKSTFVLLHLALNRSYRFRVRGTDRAHHTSAWMVEPAFRPVLYQDTASRLHYSHHWTQAHDANASGGTRTGTSTSGAQVTFSFTARTIALVAPTDAHRGRAEILIDGILVQTIDLHSLHPHQQQLVFQHDWHGVEAHTIVVRNLGTAGHPRIDVDAFVIFR